MTYGCIVVLLVVVVVGGSCCWRGNCRGLIVVVVVVVMMHTVETFCFNYYYSRLVASGGKTKLRDRGCVLISLPFVSRYVLHVSLLPRAKSVLQLIAIQIIGS
jgi:hypothetical protein